MEFTGNWKQSEIYLKEERYENILEHMKFQINIMSKNGLDNLKICDMGCSNGEFIYNLNKRFPNNTYIGYDCEEKLLKVAKNAVKTATFIEGNIMNVDLIEPNTYDIIICSGIIQIFDNFEKCYENLVKWTKKGGRIYVFGIFNEYPYDVYTTIKHNDNDTQKGWNNISKLTISKLLDHHCVESYNFTKFIIPIDVKQQEDLLRAWSIQLSDGTRMLTNGLGIIQNMELLEIIV